MFSSCIPEHLDYERPCPVIGFHTDLDPPYFFLLSFLFFICESLIMGREAYQACME